MISRDDIIGDARPISLELLSPLDPNATLTENMNASGI
jgi:hypothetical protein